MFSEITQLHYEQARGREHIWKVGNGEAHLAGAVLGTGIVRVRLRRGAQLSETRYQLVDGQEGTLPYHSWAVVRGDEQWPTLGSERDMQSLLEPYLQGFAYSETELRLTRALSSQERLYGFAEHTGEMNRRDESFPLWNVDPSPPYTLQTEMMYTSIPFGVSVDLDNGRAYGMLIDFYGRINVDTSKNDSFQATLQGDELVVYFFLGPDIPTVLRQYSDLTGRMPLPARWTLGHHQSRWGYASQEKVLDIANRLRAGNFPTDSLWLDIDYMDGYRVFTWNDATFSDPGAVIQKLHEQGLRLVTIVDPGVKIDEGYAVFRDGMQKDYFCHLKDGEVFVGSVWPGDSVFPDFSRAEVRAWWGSLYDPMLAQGVDGMWNDMNEPAIIKVVASAENETAFRTETMSEDVLHGAGGNQASGPDGPPVAHTFFHNAYGLEMARSTYEELVRQQPDARPFVLTRSGTTGVQRYAALWTGDNSSQWEHLLMGIRMCLGVGMSGVPFIGADIGGFWGNCHGELPVRFVQMGALTPFSRNHNAAGNVDQEPWAFGEPYASAYRTAIETRYRLLPYLYTLFQQAATDGAPIMRPLFYSYPQDEQAHDTDTQFLIGDTLLSAPIYEAGATSREVYLPAGTWFDYWDRTEYFGGGTSVIPAPLERWPLLVRGNSILPSGPVLQYTGQQTSDPLTFTCYMAEDGLANYTLYEDDGNTQNYRKGAFARTSISCSLSDDSVTLRIDEQHSGYTPQWSEYEITVYAGGRTLQQRVKVGQGSVLLHM